MIEFAKKENGERGRFLCTIYHSHWFSFPMQVLMASLCAGAALCGRLEPLSPGNSIAYSPREDGWLFHRTSFADYRLYRSENYFRTEAVKGTWRDLSAGGSAGLPKIFCRIACFFTNQGFYIDRLGNPLPAAEFEKPIPGISGS